jgi:acyl-coenzyme A thioesterase PaaI-like protein
MLHGRAVLAMLDEAWAWAWAWACIATGRCWAVTSETSTRFHRAVYVDMPHLVEAEITETTIMNIGRVIDLKGRIRADARATFTILGKAELKRAAGETCDTLHASMHLS